MEQAICYAAILINYAKESQHDFDELLIEKNRYGAVWVHFAVRPSNNRRKVMFLNAERNTFFTHGLHGIVHFLKNLRKKMQFVGKFFVSLH
jgi:hypothetical protein